MGRTQLAPEKAMAPQACALAVQVAVMYDVWSPYHSSHKRHDDSLHKGERIHILFTGLFLLGQCCFCCACNLTPVFPARGKRIPFRRISLTVRATCPSRWRVYLWCPECLIGHTKNGVHLTGQRPTRICPWLDAEMLSVAVYALKSMLDVVRQSAHISCTSFEFTTKTCIWCIIPRSQILLSERLQGIYPSWLEKRGALAWGGPLTPPIPASCERERAGTGCGKSHGGIVGTGFSVVMDCRQRVNCEKGKAANAFPGSGGRACPTPTVHLGDRLVKDTVHHRSLLGTSPVQDDSIMRDVWRVLKWIKYDLKRDSSTTISAIRGHVPSSHGARRKAAAASLKGAAFARLWRWADIVYLISTAMFNQGPMRAGH